MGRYRFETDEISSFLVPHLSTSAAYLRRRDDYLLFPYPRGSTEESQGGREEAGVLVWGDHSQEREEVIRGVQGGEGSGTV